jgi:aryl-alcohol dehydrogenase-like predicted oxidoreductase
MTKALALPGGFYQLGDLLVSRVGFGAMQLAGPGVFGPPADPDQAVAVLREAVELGVRHIDTAEFYGPHVTNELIHRALAPYPEEVHIVTKVGAVRDSAGAWIPQLTPDGLREQVHANLRTLKLDALDVVNLRAAGGDDGHSAVPGSIAEPFGVLAELQGQGLIRHLGLSNVSTEQLAEAQGIARVVCVQNFYNIARREDDDLVDLTARERVAYVPFFPLGGFTPLQHGVLGSVAARLGVSAQAVALAWLLRRSPNMLVIPGTSTVAHLRENVGCGSLELDDATVAELNAIGG